MDNPLRQRLETYGPLENEDRDLLDQMLSTRRDVAAGEPVIREDDDPHGVRLVVDGFACRYKTLPDGKRQIVAYMVPGDFCDLFAFVLDERDHNVAAVSASKVVDITPDQIAKLTARPNLARALWRSSLADEAVLREWIVNIGARSAEARIAHFFCEITLRLQVVGLADLGGCYLPLTQTDIADTLGLSLVHTNRSLQHLRAKGLFTLSRARLDIPNFKRLEDASYFDRTYLHLGRAKFESLVPRMVAIA